MENEPLFEATEQNEVLNETTTPVQKVKSKSVKIKKALKKIPLSTGFKCLGNIIKIIAFLVALAIIAVHALAAYILFAFRPLYLSICIAIVAFGFVLALIVLFLIYALGHSINQNNEIIALLKDKDNL